MKQRAKHKAHQQMLDQLTDGSPSGEFKHSTIGADDKMQGYLKGYEAAINDIIKYIETREA